MFSAAIFDFDGTLADTMDLHYQAYRDVFSAKGWELNRDTFYAAIGDKAQVTIPRIAQRALSPAEIHEIHIRKKARVEELFLAAPVPVLSPALLMLLLARKVPMALASSGSRPGIDILLKRMNWHGHFSAIVTGEDVTHGKPHPEIYLLAAERLLVSSDSCLVFEDTDAGVSSARAAGMIAIDVRKPLNVPVLGEALGNGRAI